MTLVAHGINRIKYSCDCIDALVDELKIAATDEKWALVSFHHCYATIRYLYRAFCRCKVLFAVDGYNSFYVEDTMIYLDRKYETKAEDISIIQSLFKMIKPDWVSVWFYKVISQ